MTVQRIDWPQLIEDLAYMLGQETGDGLMRAPANTTALAVMLKVPRSTLRHWRDGGQPPHSDGEMLLERWVHVTGKPRQFAPTERAPLSARNR